MPLLQAKRSNESSAWPNAVDARRGLVSIETGTPSAPNAVSIDARERSSDGHTIAISSGAMPSRTSSSTVSATSSSVARRPGSLEEAHRAVERRRRGAVVEEVALEMSEARRQVGVRAGSELDDVATRERAEVGDRPRERGKRRPARLVRQRDVHLTARRERLDQAPLRSRQILEAVREDRGAVPRPELARQALDGPAANHAAIADGEPLELGPVGARQLGQPGPRSSGSSRLASISVSTPARESAKPAKRADGPSEPGGARGDEVPEHERALGIAERARDR